MGTSNYVSVLENEYIEYSKVLFEQDNGYGAEGFDEDIIRKGLEVVEQFSMIPTKAATFLFYTDMENNQFYLEWHFNKCKERMMIIVKMDKLSVHRTDMKPAVDKAWKVYKTLQEVIADDYIYTAFLELGAKEYAA